MIPGFNHNIRYRGVLYHIQTEDSGIENPVVTTLLYKGGTILSSKRTSYSDIVSSDKMEEVVREIMKEQHKGMIKELLAGKHTDEYKEEGEGFRNEVTEGKKTAGIQEAETPEELITQREEKVEPKEQITKSLDDILLNYIMKRAK